MPSEITYLILLFVTCLFILKASWLEGVLFVIGMGGAVITQALSLNYLIITLFCMLILLPVFLRVRRYIKKH